MIEIQVPNLGQSGMDVTIERWRVKAGERIEKGQTLYELSNEKLTQEIESPASGTVAEILVCEGNSVPIDTVIARIQED
jgi:pyruvate/2-oxoglutarate dehydrogenase complex dihydrolipoamide acyltransferase (E2) component